MIKNTEKNGWLLNSGIGINVNMTDFSNIDQKATSLLVETKQSYDKNCIIKSLASNMLENFCKFCELGFEYFKDDIVSNMAFVGTSVNVNIFDDKMFGVFQGVDNDGNMLLSTSDQKILTIKNGRILL